MSTVSTILDEASKRLQDPDNKIWGRTELLDYLNDGQHDLAAKTGLLATFVSFDSPGRWGFAASFPWEVEQVRPARAWLAFLRYQNAQYRTTYRWELEQLDGRTPTNSEASITQPWEVAHKVTDRPLPFPLPEDHLRTIRPSWDMRRISGAMTRQMDLSWNDWWTESGLPQWIWADTLGTKQFGLFPFEAGYNQAWAYTGTYPNGSPRQYTTGDGRTYAFSQIATCLRVFNGFSTSGDALNAPGPSWRFTRAATDTDKSFTTHIWEQEQVEGKTTFSASKTIGIFDWEEEFGAKNRPACFFVGVPRELSGRDYLVDDPAYGSPRSWHSSDGGLGLIYAKIPSRMVLEAESPNEIPTRLHKYLRAYVLHRALDREGPGKNPALASYYLIRYEMGVRVFKLMATAIMNDMQWQRDTVPPDVDRRPPRVTFPPEFPRVML